MSLLDFEGFIDDGYFKSTSGTRTGVSVTYTDGKAVETTTETTYSRLNVQPLNQRDINFLQDGGERIQDTRKVYVNEAVSDISEDDRWTFDDVSGTFKCTGIDNRPWRNYCRFYAIKVDV